MGTITFTGKPTVTINASKQIPVTYVEYINNFSTGNKGSITLPFAVNVTTGNYPLTRDSTGLITVSDVKCQIGTNTIDDIKFTMTFRLINKSTTVTIIDSSTVRIVFTVFNFHQFGIEKQYIAMATSDIVNYSFDLPYTLNIYGNVYPPDVAKYAVAVPG